MWMIKMPKYIIQVFSLASLLWYSAVSTFFWLINQVLVRRTQVSRVSDDLLLVSATELARRIRNGEVTSSEVVDSFIARIRSVNQVINAVVEECFDEARSLAHSIDDKISAGTAPSQDTAPLLGVPFTLKDCIPVKGMLCTAGIQSRKNLRMTEDAESVRCLKNAGGILLAVTNVSEVCMWWESNNTIYGRSVNPYDTRRITGGSSGGEGALLAAAGSVVGIGSDIGGSIRMPAFFNGIFGHKPTKYIVDDSGHWPKCTGFQTAMHCPGPMCRFAEDLGPMLKILGGASAAQLKLDEEVEMSKVKVFYMEEIVSPFVTPVSCDMKNALKKVTKYFETRFNTACIRVNLPLLKYALPIWLNDMHVAEAPSFTQEMTGRDGDINPYLELGKWFIGKTPHTFPALSLALTERWKLDSEDTKKKLTSMREHLLKEFQELLGQNGIFLFPSHPTTAPFHNQPIYQPFNFIYTAIFNSLGLPVTQCPLGLSAEGIPTGVQVVGALYNDHLTIAVAKELQRAYGGWVNPGGFVG